MVCGVEEELLGVPEHLVSVSSACKWKMPLGRARFSRKSKFKSSVSEDAVFFGLTTVRLL